MAALTKEATLSLFEVLFSTVDDLGLDETIQLLKSSQNTKALALEDKRVEFVMRMVSEEFKIPIEQVINSYTKSTKRKFSIMFGAYYLHEEFDISFGDLRKLYKRDKGLLCKYYHSIKKLNRNKSDDRHLLKYRDKFDLQVAEYKLKH